MLSEMQFENNPDGGDVQILFDRNSMKKKPFDKRKLLWLIGAIGLIGLVIGNIWAGWGSWGKDGKHRWSPFPTPAIDANSFNSSLNVRIKDFNFDFHWHIDYDSEVIHFSVVSKNGTFADNRWLLIGFSNNGNILNSDYCVFKNKNVTDGYINANANLIPDSQQDCELVQSDENGFNFKRKFSTCDPRDVILSKGTINLFFASAESEAPNINETTTRNAKLFARIIPQPQLESDVVTMPLAARNLTVTKDIIYWCSVTKLSEDLMAKKHHLVRIEPLVSTGNEKLIEKMEMYYCNYSGSEDTIEFNGTCSGDKVKTCTKEIFAWSLGASPFDFPAQAGFPIGGPGGAGYVMVKIQYANVSPINDSSGFNLYYTPTLRSSDAAILDLGISPSTTSAIPPRQNAFALSGYCLPECSNKFPENGITIFGSKLHTHSAGKLIRTSIYRNGKRIGDLNFDKHFAFDWPITDTLEPQITVEKGDLLMTTCVYHTENRTDVTFGGDNPESEMCSNLVYYYPAMEVTICRSAVDDTALQTWFKDKNQIDTSKTYVEKFKALTWDKSMIDDLIELYSTASLKAECFNQSGSILDGNNLKKPFISKISEESRIKYECPSIDDL